MAKNNDVVAFFLPDFKNFGPAASGIPDMWKSTIDFTKAAVQGQKDDGQTWKYDFVTCWEDLPVCLWVMCCPCCTAARTMAAADGRTCEAHCINLVASCCLSTCYVGSVRGSFRKKYGLAGSPAEDILLTCCLAPCLLCQLAREAQDRAGFTVPLADKLASKAPAGQEASRDAAPAPAAEAPTPAAAPAEVPAAAAAPAEVAAPAATAAAKDQA